MRRFDFVERACFPFGCIAHMAGAALSPYGHAIDVGKYLWGVAGPQY